MFHESTQRTLWFFDSASQLASIRNSKYKSFVTVNAEDEKQIVLYYDRLVREFCDTCKPRIPRPTMATACAYLKRVYLKNNIIDYPIELYYRTCIYLACKVDEFNLTADDFRAIFVTSGSSEKDADFLVAQIISTELKLIGLLNYSLIIYSPYRPIEGFLIAMKHFYIHESEEKNPDVDEKAFLSEIDSISSKADNFILWSLATDVCFLFSPSQIALAAILYASRNANFDIVLFIKHVTKSAEDPNCFENVHRKLREIIDVVKSLKLPSKEVVKSILAKVDEVLECRNEENM